MKITAEQVKAMAARKPDAANMNSILVALNEHGATVGLDQPHRLAQFLAQVMHESADFRYDREVWGPTPAQRRYDVRADLGNTAARDGDGFLYRGRTGIQTTGKSNYRQFRDWCRKTFPHLKVPDFVKDPDAILTDPWEGLSPIWYWTTRGLNRYADEGDIDMITRRVNGGYNGFADRKARYGRAALVLLGYKATGLKAFQADHGLTPDGIVGPRTIGAMHKALVGLSKDEGQVLSPDVKKAPVTEKEPVTPPQLDKPVTETGGFWERIFNMIGAGGATILSALFGDWRVVAIVAGLLIFVAVIGLVAHKRVIDTVRSIKEGIKA